MSTHALLHIPQPDRHGFKLLPGSHDESDYRPTFFLPQRSVLHGQDCQLAFLHAPLDVVFVVAVPSAEVQPVVG